MITTTSEPSSEPTPRVGAPLPPPGRRREPPGPVDGPAAFDTAIDGGAEVFSFSLPRLGDPGCPPVLHLDGPTTGPAAPRAPDRTPVVGSPWRPDAWPVVAAAPPTSALPSPVGPISRAVPRPARPRGWWRPTLAARVATWFMALAALLLAAGALVVHASARAHLGPEGQQAVEAALRAAAPPVLALAALAGALLALRVATPLRAIVAAAPRREDARAPALAQGSDELDALAGALEAAHRRERDAARREARFLDSAARVLGEPLGVIADRAGLALHDDDPRESLRHVVAAAARGRALLERLALLARAEAGQRELHPEPIELAPLLRAAWTAQRDAAGDRGVTLALEVEEGLELRADLRQARALLDELVANSVRHADRAGQVIVRAYARRDTVLIEVMDEGEGIRPESLPRIFERMVAPTPERPGLGLATVRAIARAHGGDAEVASVLGQGTTLSITLPRAT